MHFDALINLLGPGPITARMAGFAPRPFGLLDTLGFLLPKRSGLPKSRSPGLLQFLLLLIQFLVLFPQLLLGLLQLQLQRAVVLLQMQHQCH
jgi:hypothetical protein